ncbi:hypothetical protein ACFLTB_04200 [Chloroflexota bacterium]
MIAELRNMNGKLALHTTTTDIERKLKKLKSFIYSVPYYSTTDGKIVGIDLYFDESAKTILKKLSRTNQLPLF